MDEAGSREEERLHTEPLRVEPRARGYMVGKRRNRDRVLLPQYQEQDRADEAQRPRKASRLNCEEESVEEWAPWTSVRTLPGLPQDESLEAATKQAYTDLCTYYDHLQAYARVRRREAERVRPIYPTELFN